MRRKAVAHAASGVAGPDATDLLAFAQKRKATPALSTHGSMRWRVLMTSVPAALNQCAEVVRK